MSYGVAQGEDLGTDFGAENDGSIPTLDEDLEEEINPKGLECTEKRQKVKDGDVNPPGVQKYKSQKEETSATAKPEINPFQGPHMVRIIMLESLIQSKMVM